MSIRPYFGESDAKLSSIFPSICQNGKSNYSANPVNIKTKYNQRKMKPKKNKTENTQKYRLAKKKRKVWTKPCLSIT